MLRVKNKLPTRHVFIEPKKVLKNKNCNLGKIQVLSFCENVTTVNKCLKIILWGYHLCQVNPKYAMALEVPLSLKKLFPENNQKNKDDPNLTKEEEECEAKNKTLRFGIGFYDTMSRRYTHFIEYDGHSGHYTDVKMITNDVMKERFCASLNVKLLRISSKYVLDYKQLDDWFYSSSPSSSSSFSSSVSYFLPDHYVERDKLVQRLNI